MDKFMILGGIVLYGVAFIAFCLYAEKLGEKIRKKRALKKDRLNQHTTGTRP